MDHQSSAAGAGCRFRIPPHAGYGLRTIVLTPGVLRRLSELPVTDALIIVHMGEVELETAAGDRLRFTQGAVLTFAGLAGCVIRNPCATPAVLLAITRRGRLPT